jgi:hypothetical protein
LPPCVTELIGRMREQWPDVDMTTPIDKRSAAISMVIRFVFRHWLNQSALALTVAGGLLGATVAVIFGVEACYHPA